MNLDPIIQAAIDKQAARYERRADGDFNCRDCGSVAVNGMLLGHDLLHEHLDWPKPMAECECCVTPAEPAPQPECPFPMGAKVRTTRGRAHTGIVTGWRQGLGEWVIDLDHDGAGWYPDALELVPLPVPRVERDAYGSEWAINSEGKPTRIYCSPRDYVPFVDANYEGTARQPMTLVLPVED